jgi:Mycothiol maleylpyruvate isomerase N-terminal domain
MNVTDARIAVDEATKRFAALLRSSPDPAMRIRHSDWTVADVAAHVLSFAEAYEGYLQDDSDPVVRVHDLNIDNARNLARLDERDIGILTDRLARASAAFLAASDGLDATHPMRWHDVAATVGTVYGIYLGELLIHGDDVARTLRRSWPITRTEGAIVFEAIAQAAPWFVDARGAVRDAAFEVNARKGPTFSFRFASASLTVEAGRATRPDCRIWGDAVALVLVLYKRRSQWTQIARGRLIAGGRRPWLALSFVDRFGGY